MKIIMQTKMEIGFSGIANANVPEIGLPISFF